MTKVTTLILGTLVAGALSAIAAEETIDDQIIAIQNAPAQQRVELMNRFKQNMANMNEAERIQATNRLRQKLQVRDQSGAGTGAQLQNRMQQQNMTPMQNMQMNQMQQQNISPMQNMQMGGGMQGGAMQGGKR